MAYQPIQQQRKVLLRDFVFGRNQMVWPFVVLAYRTPFKQRNGARDFQ